MHRQAHFDYMCHPLLMSWTCLLGGLTSTTGAGSSFLRGPGRLTALKTRKSPPRTSTYGLRVRARAATTATLTMVGFAAMSAGTRARIMLAASVTMQ